MTVKEIKEMGWDGEPVETFTVPICSVCKIPVLNYFFIEHKRYCADCFIELMEDDEQ